MLRAITLGVCVLAGLRGQSTNTAIGGRITDPSKALIAAARVAAISAGTNLHYEVLSNASGEYHLSNLPPGTYRIEVDKPGFKRLVKTDVALHVQDALTIDFELQVGPVSETITVQDARATSN